MTDEQFRAYIAAEQKKRYPGLWTVKESSLSFDPVTRTYKPPFVTTTRYSSFAEADATSLGGPASITYKSAVYAVLRYWPNQIQNAQGNWVNDPADSKPSEPFYLKVRMRGSGGAADATDSGETRNPKSESLALTVSPMGGVTGAPVSLGPWDIFDLGNSKSFYANRDFYLKIKPSGALVQTVSLISIAAMGALTGNRTTPTYSGGSPRWNHGSTRISLGVDSELTSYYMEISDGSGDSWKKLTGDLPTEYKKWGTDANNKLVLVPDPNLAELVSPPGVVPQVWRVKSLRASDGSITVERAAEWRGSQWMGSIQFNTICPGFTSPTFSWTKPSGAIGGNTSASSLDLTIVGDGRGHYIRGINLGGDAGGKGMVSTSDAKVTVSDSNATLSNVYKVNWHVPNEWGSKPKTAPGPNRLFDQPGYIVDSNGNYKLTIGANRTVNFKVEAPVTQFKLVTKDSVGGASVILGVASAGATLLGLASGPEGWLFWPWLLLVVVPVMLLALCQSRPSTPKGRITLNTKPI